MEYQRFVKRFIIVNLSIIILFGVISYTLLDIFRENYSDNVIIQNYKNILYGSALDDGALLKLNIVAKEKPKVIALGSSRVMQFRSEFFINKDFYTLGGIGASIDEVVFAWNNIQESYIPDVVIIGIDPWWLNPKYKQDNRWTNVNPNQYSKYLNLYKGTKILKQILNTNEIKAEDSLSGLKNIGLDAAVNGNGYRLSDGSRQYGKTIHDKENNDTRFKSTYERMKQGAPGDRFVWCDSISEQELNKLKDLLAEIQQSGAQVIVFLPPFPHEIYNYMNDSIHFHDYLHAYMDETKKICSDLGIPWYNFADLATTGSSDDETIDGFHGSEVAYARITYLIGKNNPLANYVNNEKLEYAIQHPIDNFQVIPASK